MRRAAIIVLIVVSLVGFVDSSYLTAQHYSGETVVCEVGGKAFGDCDSVLGSSYAEVAGIPVALAGAAYYFIVFVLASMLLSAPKRTLLALIAALTGIGLAFSLWFVYLQLFVLEAVCLYCMLSALSTTVLFVTSVLALRTSTGATPPAPPLRRV